MSLPVVRSISRYNIEIVDLLDGVRIEIWKV